MAFDPSSDNAMLVNGEVSSAITYHPWGAGDAAIRGVLVPSSPYEAMDERGRAHVREATLYIRNDASAGRTSIDPRDEVTVGGSRYAIVSFHEDQGMWTLLVRVTLRRERAGGPWMQPRM